MKVVIQRVNNTNVSIAGKIVAETGPGLNLLVGLLTSLNNLVSLSKQADSALSWMLTSSTPARSQ